jgi:hypothetical protein
MAATIDCSPNQSADLIMRNPASSSPTVIVARRVLAGREDDYRAWHERIRHAAAEFPGYLSTELQPPDAAHPGEWITVYSFATAGELDTWLHSAERRDIVAAGAHLIEPEVREQHVAALRTAPEPVTVVFSQVIERDSHQAFGALYEDGVHRMQSFPGFLGSELLPPVAGVQKEHVIVASFASRPDLDRWLQSDSRIEWLADATRLIEGERIINVVGGFGGWFPGAVDRPQGPKRWKQAVAVLLALYPTSLLITAVRSEVAPDMNMALAVLVANVLGVATLSFLLMPIVTRWLDGWLSR